MQLSNDFVIISKDVSTDQMDSMVTIFKIIDNFQFTFRKQDFQQAFGVEPGKKVVLPATYSIATSWSLPEKVAKDVPFSLKVTITDPQDIEINSIIQEAAIPKGNDKMRFNLNTQGLAVTSSGRYTVTVEASDSNGEFLTKGQCFVNVTLEIKEN